MKPSLSRTQRRKHPHGEHPATQGVLRAAGQSHLNRTHLEHGLHIRQIPASTSAFTLNAQLFGRFLLELGQRHAPDACEIGWRVVLAHLTGIFPETDVQ